MNLVRQWARRYYDLHLNPLPSSGKAKRPAMDGPTIRRYREERIPEAWLTRWWAPNIQIPLGVRWGCCVIDIDGLSAFRQWIDWIWKECFFSPWVSAAPHGPGLDYSRSRHIWFRLPEGMAEFRTVVLWSGGPHEEIKVLGDRSLVVAPPSIHPERKNSYRWLFGPDDCALPAVLPSWLHLKIELKLLEKFNNRPFQPRPRPSGLFLPAVKGRRYQRDEVLYALGDRKHEIAQAYGLEVRRHPNSAGFYECRAVDREDQRWSCTIDPRTGVYRDWATGETLAFFDLLMRLDPVTFPKFPITVNKLGAYALGEPQCPRQR